MTTPTVPAETIDPKVICYGCLTYKYTDKVTNESFYCYIQPVVNGKICPCSTCILKIVCEETCSEFNIYLDKMPILNKPLKEPF